MNARLPDPGNRSAFQHWAIHYHMKISDIEGEQAKTNNIGQRDLCLLQPVFICNDPAVHYHATERERDSVTSPGTL